MSQLINQSVGQSTSQPVGQPVTLWVGQLLIKSVSQSVSQLVRQLGSQSISYLVNQKISQTVNQLVSLPVGQTVKWIEWTDQSVNTCRSVIHSAAQPVSQFVSLTMNHSVTHSACQSGSWMTISGKKMQILDSVIQVFLTIVLKYFGSSNPRLCTHLEAYYLSLVFQYHLGIIFL